VFRVRKSKRAFVAALPRAPRQHIAGFMTQPLSRERHRARTRGGIARSHRAPTLPVDAPIKSLASVMSARVSSPLAGAIRTPIPTPMPTPSSKAPTLPSICVSSSPRRASVARLFRVVGYVHSQAAALAPSLSLSLALFSSINSRSFSAASSSRIHCS
jgi:hypothetical protein